MALFVYGLAAGELSRNGGRRALMAAAEHRGGGWLVLTLSGEPLPTKPPGTSIAIALASLPEGRGTAVTARLPSALAALAVAVLLCLGWAAAVAWQVGWDALAETVRCEALLRLSPGHPPRPYPWGDLVAFSAHDPAGLPAVVGARAAHPAPRARRPVGRPRRQAALAIAVLGQPALLLRKGGKMPFFDLFGWSRSRRAPTSFRKRVRFTVEQLESRLVPSASGWSSPGDTLPRDTVAPPSEVRLCAVCAPAVMVQAPVSGDRLADVSANGDYTVTVSSGAQDGTGWNGSTPGGAPASAGNATAPSDYFSLTCPGDLQVGQGWAVPALPPTASAA
jgi:hypothetical protein